MMNTNSNNIILRLEGIGKSFGALEVLKKVDLTVQKGERIAVIGESGCGKSLFLRLIELLEKPDRGRIYIGQDEITAPKANVNKIRQRLGMVYQDFRLFEHLNILDNITLAPCHLLGRNRRDAERKAVELLQMTGLESKKYDRPSVLSGGQKQRAAIARALAMDPEILLFDEPTSALDPAMTGEVLAAIRMLAKREMTMIIVTHEMNFAREVADRVLYFDRGGIGEQGTPAEIFDSPKTPELCAFLRRQKSFSARINRRDFDLMALHGGIRLFAERYGIAPKAAWRLQLCVEELIGELIAGCFDSAGYGTLELQIEYGQTDRKVLLRCVCQGERFNPFELPDDGQTHLGLTILRKTSRTIDFQYREGNNTVVVTM